MAGVQLKENQVKDPVSAVTELEARKSPWFSIWLCNILQLLNGIQFSILFTSMWPYLRILDSSADLNFYGWIVAVFPLGQTIGSFLFGVWNQKTKSAKHPTAVGVIIMGVGNLLYGTLPLYRRGAKWAMLIARFIVGVGSGNLSVLRTYVAVGAAPKDRVSALSFGIALFVLGLSIGPVAMLMFTPLGEEGFHLGALRISMYNLPAWAMVIVALVSLLLLYTCFQEKYAGILTNKDDQDGYFVVPKFDKIAAGICIGLWFVMQSCGTNVEVLMIPLSMTLYNWDNNAAIFRVGILVLVSTLISFTVYMTFGLTRMGKFDKRKMLFFGMSMFALYHFLMIPWPFYSGPLDYIPLTIVGNSTVEDTSKGGGCLREYTWCKYTTRVPLPVFVIASTIITGTAFSSVGVASGTLFSEILGPRNQGFMQGLFALFGSIGRFLGPIVSTLLFEKIGYSVPMAILLGMVLLADVVIITFRKRLVPLKLIPPIGVKTPYKNGVFYRF